MGGGSDGARYFLYRHAEIRRSAARRASTWLVRAAGRLKLPCDSDWYLVDLGTNSFGQGVAVTPIQMVMAASALANDGKMVVPHVLYGMVTNGRQYNTPAQIAGTPITAQTARTATEMLAQSLERGEGTVDLQGYRVAGKTGTAQIPGANGAYLSDATNASFVGWGPADDPQFLIYVWLERPEQSVGLHCGCARIPGSLRESSLAARHPA